MKKRFIHMIPLIMAAGIYFPAWWLRSSHDDPYNKALGGAMMGVSFFLFAYYILRELFKKDN
jgi:hypothetical protein